MPQRATRTSFKPGQSGNPGGVPKVFRALPPEEVRLRQAQAREAMKAAQDLARCVTPEAVAKLVHLMRNAKKEETQQSAAMALLDRGLGKAQQSIDVNVMALIEGMNLEELRKAKNLLTSPLIDVTAEPLQ
jgi:uncharacterized protein YcbK (DUF882 family)